MALHVSPSYEGVIDLVGKTPTATTFQYEIQFIVGVTKVTPLKLTYLTDIADFVMKYSSDLIAECVFVDSDYVNLIYPARRTLKAVIRKIPIGEVTPNVRTGDSITVREYHAILQESKDAALQGNASYSSDLAMKTVSFELLELGEAQVQLVTVGGIFTNTTPWKVLRALLTRESKALELPDSGKIVGVQATPSDAIKPLPNVIVPHGTRLVDLAGVLQNNCGGIYNYGAGCFLRHTHWFVFPPFDVNQYSKSKFSIDLVLLPPNRRPASNRTYALKENTLFILVTGETKQFDLSELNYINRGNGVRFQKATETFLQSNAVKGNKAVLDPSQTTAQFTVEQRVNHLESVPFADVRVTDNAAAQVSKIAERAGQYVACVWDNANVDLLRPGTPVRVLYNTETGEQELYGVLVGYTANTQLAQPGMTGERYTTTAALTVFVSKRKDPIA